MFYIRYECVKSGIVWRSQAHDKERIFLIAKDVKELLPYVKQQIKIVRKT